jgi:hypothetical protein
VAEEKKNLPGGADFCRQQRLGAVLELAFGELDGTRQQVQLGYFSGDMGRV